MLPTCNLITVLIKTTISISIIIFITIITILAPASTDDNVVY